MTRIDILKRPISYRISSSISVMRGALINSFQQITGQLLVALHRSNPAAADRHHASMRDIEGLPNRRILQVYPRICPPPSAVCMRLNADRYCILRQLQPFYEYHVYWADALDLWAPLIHAELLHIERTIA